MKGQVTIALLVIFLNGCVTAPKSNPSHDTTLPCCSSFDEIKYKALSRTEQMAFNINESSPVYVFSSGRSHFMAFSMPEEYQREILRLRIDVIGFTRFTEKAFCPSVLYLDSSYQELTASPLKIEWMRPGLVTSGHWIAEQEIPPNTKYLIIRTTDALLNSQLAISSQTTMAGIPTGGGVIFVPLFSPSGTPCSPMGRLTILNSDAAD